MTGLAAFLKAERNSVTREVLLRHKFVFDVLVAAARRDYALQIFVGEVDREGFDIVLDDGDAIRKIQLKSVFGKCKGWGIRKNLLRPEPRLAEDLGFEAAPTGIGIGGAVVLQVVKVEGDSLDVSYAVADIALMCAMREGFVTKNSGVKIQPQTLRTVIDQTVEGKRTERVGVPLGAFIRARSAGHLLGALGLHAPDVNCGDLGRLVAMARSDGDENQRKGARALLAEHLRAISPDFDPLVPQRKAKAPR